MGGDNGVNDGVNDDDDKDDDKGKLLASSASTSIASEAYAVIPLFVLMGLFVSATNMGRDTFDVIIFPHVGGNATSQVNGIPNSITTINSGGDGVGSGVLSRPVRGDRRASDSRRCSSQGCRGRQGRAGPEGGAGMNTTPERQGLQVAGVSKAYGGLQVLNQLAAWWFAETESIVAGSVTTPHQIDALALCGADAFTIGSAVFDGGFSAVLWADAWRRLRAAGTTHVIVHEDGFRPGRTSARDVHRLEAWRNGPAG